MKIGKTFTLEKIKSILDEYESSIHKSEMKYYVNEVSTITGETGFFTDKFYVGIHNKNTHFAMSELKAYYKNNA